MIPLAATLPESSGDGYVAAAYIVFFALVLIYVAIMAIRLARVEREVRTLKDTGRLRERGADDGGAGDAYGEGASRAREDTPTEKGMAEKGMVG
jgi:hypothetical protein